MRAIRTTILRAVAVFAACVLIVAPGCGDPFLGLQDYQRDLIFGALAVSVLNQQAQGGGVGQPVPGINGLDCWDVNGNRQRDIDEDVNGDGLFDALDCRGAPGTAGTDGADGAGTGAGGLNCWDINGNGQADAGEDANGDGVVNVFDCRGDAGADGANGGSGPPGESFFDIFVDDFFGAALGQLPVVAVSITEPALGGNPRQTAGGDGIVDAIAYRVAVPPGYRSGNDVTMRLFFFRVGTFDQDCLVFTVDAVRLRRGSDIEAYGERRWVRIDADVAEGTVTGLGLDPDVLLVVDLPINTSSGLGLPNDLAGGQFLAFELATFLGDGRTHVLLGAEFIESKPQTAVLARATVFTSDADVECRFLDCNGNRISDEDDIAQGTSQDCNGNDVPDECDLCETSAIAAVAGDSVPFTFLQAGFSQELFASADGFMGGVAFAPDGDVLVDSCPLGDRAGSSLRRFDAQSTTLINGSDVHPLIATLPSNAGCGLTNHADGTLYSNTGLGVTNLDADTGAELRAPFGPAGNGLGIAPDPVTGNLVYVGNDGTLQFVDSAFTTSGVFSTVTTGTFVDGIAFEPTQGDFLFLANRDDKSLTILDRSGALVQRITIDHDGAMREPDGMAFHASTPRFVLSVNLDGTITRFDFPNDDFSQAPAQSLFAGGGFRGDLIQVGADGRIYLTQDQTRFGDGTETNANSVVRICCGFDPPVPGDIVLAPLSATNPVGTQHTVTATLSAGGEAIVGATVDFEVLTGPNAGTMGSDITDSAGLASFSYLGLGGSGVDEIQASFSDTSGTRSSNVVTKTWLPIDCSSDCNGNGIPDECEICVDDGGRNWGCLPDCNGNGIPDACDGGCPETNERQ